MPLYPTLPRLAVDEVEPRNVDKTCTSCAMHTRARARVCVPPEGEPGGVLVVVESPGMAEDARARPLVTDTGLDVRRALAQHWKGPVAIDHAVKCFIGREGIETPAQAIKVYNACRPYLAATIREVKPVRVVVLGTISAHVVLGRAVAAFTMRRSYAYRYTDDGPPIPVMLVMSHSAIRQNSFVRKMFNADLEWALTATPPLPPWDGEVQIVETKADAERAIAYLRKRGTPVAFDVETAGERWAESFRIVSLSMCAEGDDDAFLWPAAALREAGPLNVLLDYLEDASAPKTGQNVKYDQLSIEVAYGVEVRGVVADSRLQRKLLEPDSGASLAEMANLVGMGGMKEDNAAKKLEAVGAVRKVFAAEAKVKRWLLACEQRDEEATVRLAEGTRRKAPPMPAMPPTPPTLASIGVDAALEALIRSGHTETDGWVYGVLEHTAPEVMHAYNARDAVATARLGQLQREQLAKVPELSRVWSTIVAPAAQAIVQVERWGVAVDRGAIERFDRHLTLKISAAENALDAAFPGVNWASTDQVAEVLFDKLRLHCPKETPGGKRSTDEEVLSEIAEKHPIARAILDNRHYSKLRSTYARGMVPFIRDDGRIHPSILLDGARSGRTSVQDPALQTIPRPETPEGIMARDIFCAPPGYKIISADYSQIELRVAAMVSGDDVMIDIFKSGHDFHMRTAQMISKMVWGIEPDKCEKKHRTEAKAVNFGILYGTHAASLAETLGITVREAEAVVAAIFGKFKKLAAWIAAQLKYARLNGHVWTVWDGQNARRRHLWRVADQDEKKRGNEERATCNTPIQGTASDFCIASLTACVDWIQSSGTPAKLILPVHDALMFEVADADVERVATQVRKIMESMPAGGVPLVVDLEAGQAWGSLKELKLPPA
jgi:uracil-DNA glycosylase family 4